MHRNLLKAVSSIAVAFSLPAAAAYAQDTTAPPAATEDEEAVLDTITVTTRKREENLQEVPIAVDVLSEDDIISKGIADIADVAGLTPSLTFDVGLLPTDTRVSMRGLQAVRGRPNVAILVDGVDASSENFGVAGGGILANLRFVDVERIEVVKGPQNVLYGRSAFGGAINYITKKPSYETEGNIRGALSSFSTFDAAGGVSLPIIDDVLSARINAAYYQTDGQFEDRNGNRLNTAESVGGAIALRFDPTDTFNANLRLQYSEEDYSPRADVLLRSINSVTGFANTPDLGTTLPDRRPNRPAPIYTIVGDLSQTQTWRQGIVDQSGDPNAGGAGYEGTNVDTLRGNFSATWETGFGDIDWLAGFTHNISTFNQDFDNTNYSLLSTGVPAYEVGGPFSTLNIFRGPPFRWPLTFLPAYGLSAEFDAKTKIKQQSYEMRWSEDWGRVRAIADVLYWHEDSSYNDKSLFWARQGTLPLIAAFNSFGQGGTGFHLFSPPATSPNPQLITRSTDSLSGALGLEFDLTESFTIGLEGRQIEDEIEYTGFDFDPFRVNTLGARRGPFTRTNPPIETKKFTPKATLSWQATDGLLLFGTYAEGTKPGGVDTTDQNGNVNDGRFLPEKVTATELGMKFSTPGGRFLLNGSVFENIYEDQQIGILETIAGVQQSRTVNIGESESKGVELDLQLGLTDNLGVRANYAYVDSKYTDYILPRCGAVDSAESRTANCNFNGKKSPLTPEHKLNIGVRYDRDIGENWSFFFDSDSRYESERFMNSSNLAFLPEYWQTDLVLGFGDNDGLIIETFVKNLFDDDSPRTGTASVDYGFFDLTSQQLPRGYLLALTPPREAGVRVSKKF